MIVKVQQSIVPKGTSLIYDESGKIFWQGQTPPIVKELLGKKPKAFLHARVFGKNLQLIKLAPWQSW